jgi:hypothetical protein
LSSSPGGHLRQLAARFKYRDQVAELHGFINIVSDHNDGFAHLFLNTQKLFLQLFADHRVDRAERFVHQHKLRVCRQGAGNAHALLLASGKLPGKRLAICGSRPTTSSNSPALALALLLAAPLRIAVVAMLSIMFLWGINLHFE